MPPIPVIAKAAQPGPPLASRNLLVSAAAVGVVAAGAALLEVALIPGIALGAAALLARRVIAKPRLALRPSPLAASRNPVRTRISLPVLPKAVASLPAVLPRFAIKRSVAKTITFRIIVTSLDFSWNYVILGEAGLAAGLSGIALVAGPFFYFVHETGWNYFGSGAKSRVAGPRVVALKLPGGKELALGRALAKTIVFRLFATTNEFAVNFVVVGDAATAALLTAPGFVIGPFVYLGHEKAWDSLAGPEAL